MFYSFFLGISDLEYKEHISIFFLFCVLRLHCNLNKKTHSSHYIKIPLLRLCQSPLTYLEYSVGPHKANKIFLAKDVHRFQLKYCLKTIELTGIAVSHDCYPALHAFEQDWILNSIRWWGKGRLAQGKVRHIHTRWQHRNLKHKGGKKSIQWSFSSMLKCSAKVKKNHKESINNRYYKDYEIIPVSVFSKGKREADLLIWLIHLALLFLLHKQV